MNVISSNYLPSGYVIPAEQGEFLALDLGGSKFKVLQVKVSDNGKRNVQMESETYPIPEEIMNGRGSEVITALQTSVENIEIIKVVEKRVKTYYNSC